MKNFDEIELRYGSPMFVMAPLSTSRTTANLKLIG